MTTPPPDPIEVGIYLPQVALGGRALLERARLVEALGFHSLWLYDHLYGPGQPDRDSLEAWTAATYVLAATERLRVGHLVLDVHLRHPALLAKMATTLDVLSDGRLELGLGSGSVRLEHDQLGVEWGTAAERAERLDETLEILTAMLTQPFTTVLGAHYRVTDVPNLPGPVQHPRPPIHVGGIGPRTLPLVARHADVWNVPAYGLAGWEASHRALEAECARIGRDPADLRISHQAVVALAPDEATLPAVRAEAQRRYGTPGWGLEAGGFVGTPPMVVDRIRTLAARGVSLFVFLTHDRATPRTLELLAEAVLPELA
jgi:alkanesulfonate monooxygenase SsuD/methylene tetrahydromethanopterin reductase-like flavin-dependent oxidoreductase (luciferase family)